MNSLLVNVYNSVYLYVTINMWGWCMALTNYSLEHIVIFSTENYH